MARKAKTQMTAADIQKKQQAKRTRFERVAAKRVTAVLVKLRVLSQVSNRASYLYNAADVEKMYAAIETAVKASRSRFNTEPTEKKENLFTF